MTVMARTSLLVALAVFCSAVCVIGQKPSFPDCVNGPLAAFPICNSTLPYLPRARDIVSRLTVAEKISRMGNGSPGVSRLGLPDYEWWSEALHGVAYSPGVNFGGDIPAATSFPEPIGLGATFDDNLIRLAASVVSTEARAMNNEGRAGLDFWTPNINPFKDPRWGRGQETPGEDPYHSSRYVYQLIRGLQEGEDPRYYKIVADCKHYAGYDLEHWNNTDRVQFDAQITDQDLVEYYMPTFETCVRDAHVGSLMCSYNAVNGVPSCANAFFMQTLARDAWGLDGWITSDCGAVECIQKYHHYTNNSDDTVRLALRAGTDINCGSFYQDYGAQAIQNGAIVEADLDRALIRQFSSLIRLGYFDDPKQQPYRQYTAANVNTDHAQQLALRATVESLVLLKNDGSLPLASVKNIALVGPMAAATTELQGNYQGRAPFIISLQHGLEAISGITVTYSQGCDIQAMNASGIAAAVAVCQAADVCIFAGGLNDDVESEGHDRTAIDFPGVQLQLIQALEGAGKPLYVVAYGGGQVDMSYIRDSAKTNGILWAGYPSQWAGTAIAGTLFGTYSPAGRLPITQYPADYVNQVSMFNMNLRAGTYNPGRTYKFYTGSAVYPFGSGLSYTTFQYSWSQETPLTIGNAERINNGVAEFEIAYLVKLAKVNGEELDRSSPFTSYSVNVTNTGKVTSDNVLLAFTSSSIKPALLAAAPPIQSLYGYDRELAVAPGETRTIFLAVNLLSLAHADAEGNLWVHPGTYTQKFGVPSQMSHSFNLVGESAIIKLWPKNPFKDQK